MESMKKTVERTLVKASEAYMKHAEKWVCFGILYQPKVPDKVKERFGKKDK